MSVIVQERWDSRLENWALWVMSGGTSGRGCSPLYRLMLGERYRFDFTSSPPPPVVGEALDTDALLSTLASEGIVGSERYQAVRARYLWTGSEQEKADALRIHRDTLADRVRAARYRLEDLHLLRKGHRPAYEHIRVQLSTT